MVEALNTTTTPSLVQGQVGRRPEVSGTMQDALVLERSGTTGDILGYVTNLSTTESLVLSAQESADNDIDTTNDGYASNTLQLRVNGTLASSITVAPNSTSTFVIDGPGIKTQSTSDNELKFFRIRASDQNKAHGTVSLSFFRGALIHRAVHDNA